MEITPRCWPVLSEPSSSNYPASFFLLCLSHIICLPSVDPPRRTNSGNALSASARWPRSAKSRRAVWRKKSSHPPQRMWVYSCERCHLRSVTEAAQKLRLFRTKSSHFLTLDPLTLASFLLGATNEWKLNRLVAFGCNYCCFWSNYRTVFLKRVFGNRALQESINKP